MMQAMGEEVDRPVGASRRRSITDGISLEELKGWAIQMLQAYGSHDAAPHDNRGDATEDDVSTMNDLLRQAREGKERGGKLKWTERLRDSDPEFVRLDLSSALIKDLTTFQKQEFLHALPQNQSVQIVHLSGMGILDCMTFEEVEFMVESVGLLKRLEELFVFRGGSEAFTEDLLARTVALARNLRVLMMWGYGKIGQHPELARVLRSHRNLERVTITLPKNRPYACMDVMVMGLAEMPYLHCLNIRGTGQQEEPVISPEGIRILLNSKSLESLYLENLGLIDDHTDAICDELRTNKVLGLLDLKDNNLSDDALFTFAQTVPFNKTLQSLDLSGVQISDRGGRALAKGMAANTTLTHIELEGTEAKYADEFAILTEHNDKDWYKALDYQLRLNRAGSVGNRKKFCEALSSVSDHLGCLYTFIRQSPQYCDLSYSNRYDTPSV